MYPDAAGDISKIAKKEILFQWHQDDPVDAKEQERNNRIEERQGNQNPYIDHPVLIARAWGHESGNGIDPDIAKNIETLKTEIANIETTLKKLKEKLVRLENSLND